MTGARTADKLLAELEHELQTLAATDPETLDTMLLIYPAVMADFLDFHFFLAEADVAIRRLKLNSTIQIASLHPNYEITGSDSDSDDIDNHTNRSPYPTQLLLREASINRAAAAFSYAKDIFERNIETLRRLGHEGWRRLWLDDSAKVLLFANSFKNRLFPGVDPQPSVSETFADASSTRLLTSGCSSPLATQVSDFFTPIMV